MDSKHMGSEDLASPGMQGFKDWTSKPSKENPGGRGEKHATCDAMQCCEMSEVSDSPLDEYSCQIKRLELTDISRARRSSASAPATRCPRT